MTALGVTLREAPIDTQATAEVRALFAVYLMRGGYSHMTVGRSLDRDRDNLYAKLRPGVKGPYSNLHARSKVRPLSTDAGDRSGNAARQYERLELEARGNS